MAPTRTRARRPPHKPPLLHSSDFKNYLREKAVEIAPGDIQSLLGQAEVARERAREDLHERPRLQRQFDLGLRLVEDHVDGECPQIPYYTVSLMAVAILYFIDPLDVIPDWIPGVGRSDDALVFELAFELGRPGIERYCTFKSIPTDGLLSPPPRRVRRPPAARPAARPKRAPTKPKRPRGR
jgi:uncharacterized membrane protein YkvA (DUF1232 family)